MLQNVSPFQLTRYLQELVSGPEINNVGSYAIFNFSIDIDKFRRARDAVLTSGRALKKLFVLENSQVAWKLREDFSLPQMRFIDCSASHSPQDEALKLIEQMFSQSFDLFNDYLVDDVLIQCSESLYFYVNRFHHAVIDGWGGAVCFQDFVEYYSGGLPCLEQLALNNRQIEQEVDAKWQRYFSGPQYQKDLAYWRQHLNGAYQPVFSEKSVAEVDNDQAQTCSLMLDEAFCTKLNDFALSQGLNKQSVFVAAVAQVMATVFKLDTAVVGATVHNRFGRKEKGFIETCANVVSVAIAFDEQQSYGEYLEKTQQSLRSAYRNGRVPLDHIIKQTRAVDAKRQMPFDVMVNYLSFDYQAHIAQQPVSFRVVHNPNGELPLSIALYDYADASQIEVHIDYLTRYLDKQQALNLFDLALSLIQCWCNTQGPDQNWHTVATSQQKALLRETQVSESSVERSVPMSFDADPQMLAQVTKAFESVLEKPVNDYELNFFVAGGNSIGAAKLLMLLHQAFSIKLSLVAFMSEPSVNGVVKLLAREQQKPQQIQNREALPFPRKTGFHPLSWAQKGIIVRHFLDDRRQVFNVPVHLLIDGELNIAALESSLEALVARHGALRTRFEDRGRGYEQSVQPNVVVKLHRNTLAVPAPCITPEKLPQGLIRYLSDISSTIIDVEQGPCFYFVLTEVSEQQHVLTLVLHHLITDGWSLGQLGHELAQIYAQISQGQASGATQQSFHFSDFARAERKYLGSPQSQCSLDYWTEQLRDYTAPTRIAGDISNRDEQANRGASHWFELTQDLQQKLKSNGQQLHSALFATAYALTIRQYCPEQPIVIGMPVANRVNEAEQTISGCLVNTVLLNLNLNQPSLSQQVKKVQQTLVGALEHQSIALEFLCDNQASLKHQTRPFYLGFVVQNFDREIPAFGAATVSTLDVAGRYAKFDIHLQCFENADKTTFGLEYDTGRYSSDFIVTFADTLCHHLLDVLIAANNNG